jgi:hypothetical protein
MLSITYAQNATKPQTLLETQIKKLAEKVAKGEITLDKWQQLHADLLMEKPESKKKINLIDYG